MRVADIRGMTMTFVHCEACGAIVGAKVNGKYVTDNATVHIQWHQELAAFVKDMLEEDPGENT